MRSSSFCAFAGSTSPLPPAAPAALVPPPPCPVVLEVPITGITAKVKTVRITVDPDEPTGYYIEEVIEGDTVIHSLTAVQYDENELKRQMKAQMDEAIKSDRMKPSEAMRLLDDYERGLKAYTYLSF